MLRVRASSNVSVSLYALTVAARGGSVSFNCRFFSRSALTARSGRTQRTHKAHHANPRSCDQMSPLGAWP